MKIGTVYGQFVAHRAPRLWPLRQLAGRLLSPKALAPTRLAPSPLAPTTDAPPSLSHPVSQACTTAQFDTEEYRYWCSQIREDPRYHRKQWEFCYILQALAAQGMLAPERRGVGYGVGTEPLTAVFADRGCHIVATDLDPNMAQEAGWVNTNQHASHIAALNTRGICDPSRFAQQVAFRFVDMNHIPADFRDFDFTWSACCLEHLGSIRNGLAFIENSLATLRPGGTAVHTTELNCSSDDETLESGATVLFRQRDIRDLCARLRAEGHEVELNFNLGDQPLDAYVDVPPYTSDRHLKLQIAQYTSTSFGLIIRKGSEAPAGVPVAKEMAQAPVVATTPHRQLVSSEPRGLKARAARFLQWQTELGSRGPQILAELAKLRSEVAARAVHDATGFEAGEIERMAAALPEEIAAEIRAQRTGTVPGARPYYYLGEGRALTTLSTGHPFFVNTRDRGITTWIVLGGVWETFVDDVLCALARPGGTFLDVGANQGYYSVKLGHLVGESGAVYSFEPSPELYPFLVDNVDINGLAPRIRTFRLAAGEAPGRSVLHFTYANMGGGYVDVPGAAPIEGAEEGVAVEIARIDDLLPADKVLDLIKIDAEGFEPLVLRGMRQSLARSPGAAIVIEIAVPAWSRFGDPMAILGEVLDGRATYLISHNGRLTLVNLDQLALRLRPDFVSYVLLLPRVAEMEAAIAKFVDAESPA